MESCGSGSSKYLGGKTKGLFFLTKNSSLFSDLFPLKPSLIDWHAVRVKQETKTNNILVELIFNKPLDNEKK